MQRRGRGVAFDDDDRAGLGGPVAASYGWSPDLTDGEILAALGDLHRRRQGAAPGNEDEGGNDAAEADAQ